MFIQSLDFEFSKTLKYYFTKYFVLINRLLTDRIEMFRTNFEALGFLYPKYAEFHKLTLLNM